MKARTYTYQELNLETPESLRKILNTQAERFNKQITRGRQKGIDYTQTHGVKTPKYFSILKKDTKLTKSEMMALYQKRQRQAHFGYSQRGVKEMQKEQERIAREYFDDEDIDDGFDVAPEYVEEIRDLENYGKSKSALYYEMMKVGVDKEVYKNFDVNSRPDLGENISKNDIVKEMQRIREKVKENNRKLWGKNAKKKKSISDIPETLEELTQKARDYYETEIAPEKAEKRARHESLRSKAYKRLI